MDAVNPGANNSGHIARTLQTSSSWKSTATLHISQRPWWQGQPLCLEEGHSPCPGPALQLHILQIWFYLESMTKCETLDSGKCSVSHTTVQKKLQKEVNVSIFMSQSAVISMVFVIIFVSWVKKIEGGIQKCKSKSLLYHGGKVWKNINKEQNVFD